MSLASLMLNPGPVMVLEDTKTDSGRELFNHIVNSWLGAKKNR